ncbi:succinate dehydrogenase cytochrome b subunit [Tessaracoccus sp. HDW20]|uniref:succinate dehydrogenase cytochrome b subunit n=1 Tax=Tessaracoccus coleopterorum TaxID=2714950 RepID=UPI0018D3DF2D|nr:succinate dehydrogenase cytochrome b subunit [Tessaracoccus coleopterorum]NHB84440.1 succinate dehydrogenase cytochrome b subunit [Tessaracoccus coleopterorum]
MAVSGALWVAFVSIHLFGNLKVFQGPEAFNGYAAWLREAFYPLLPKSGVLWALRVALVVSLVAHVGSAAVVWWRGRRARGPHRAKLHGLASWSSRLMPVTGVVLLLFLVIHLLDLTTGTAPVAPDGFAHPAEGTAHAYQNLVASFGRPLMAWFYVAVMALLSLHIAKGATTMAADLGVMGRRWRAGFTIVGGILAVAILLGNAAIPVLVQMGVLA